MDFSSSLADTDVWMKASNWADGKHYYKYLLVYDDDIIIIIEVAEMVLKHMKESYGYYLEDVGEPESYLSADIGQQKGVFGYTCFISPVSYVNKAITNVEERFGSLKIMFEQSTNDTPSPTTCHP